MQNDCPSGRCACSCGQEPVVGTALQAGEATAPGTGRKTLEAGSSWPSPGRLALGLGGLAVWFFVYGWLLSVSRFLTYSVLGLEHGSHLGNSVEFFLYDTPKVLMLLTLVVFGVGIIRSFFTPERTRRILAGRRESAGNLMAALLGIVTPFCSCSAVPLFIGFVSAGVPLGVTFSFLISAPMVNEIAVVLLYGLLGWKVAALYMGMGLLVAIVAGWVLGRLNLEGHVEDWVLAIRAGGGDAPVADMTANDRINYGIGAVKEILGRTWKWVILGIAVGAGIHGYVPEGFMAGIMGEANWWSVPLAVVIGIPMYSNAAGIVPVVEALLSKGAALGTVLAFIMAVIALSLPEMIILRKVLKVPLLLAFAGIVGLGILLVGYLFNTIL
ncbi:permease [Desulfovibrio sp. DV]|uniref:permease n=1 Tax=Desulfovibrio sp. DV TaxID=1844708 RepID=UPI0009F86894|nr:permease [Desulfovibrio sp. DV]